MWLEYVEMTRFLRILNGSVNKLLQLGMVTNLYFVFTS